jgi:hypothetical protein
MPNQCKRHIDSSHHSTREGFSNIQHLSKGRRQAHPNSDNTEEAEPHTTPRRQRDNYNSAKKKAGHHPLDTVVHNTIIDSSRKQTGSPAHSIHAARTKQQVCVQSKTSECDTDQHWSLHPKDSTTRQTTNAGDKITHSVKTSHHKKKALR